MSFTCWGGGVGGGDTVLEEPQGTEMESESNVLHTRSHGHLALALQDDFAVEAEGGQHALLEEHHIVLPQSKKAVFGEEGTCGLHGPTTGHDIPAGQGSERQSPMAPGGATHAADTSY